MRKWLNLKKFGHIRRSKNQFHKYFGLSHFPPCKSDQWGIITITKKCVLKRWNLFYLKKLLVNIIIHPQSLTARPLKMILGTITYTFLLRGLKHLYFPILPIHVQGNQTSSLNFPGKSCSSTIVPTAKVDSPIGTAWMMVRSKSLHKKWIKMGCFMLFHQTYQK